MIKKSTLVGRRAIKVNSVVCLIFPSQHAPGVPRILVGNRLHLAFKRQVPTEQARAYAEKNGMTFFEVSPLCNFNVIESFTELSRIVLMRHGMEKFWRPNRGEWTGSRGGRKGLLRQRVEVKQSEQFLECLEELFKLLL